MKKLIFILLIVFLISCSLTNNKKLIYTPTDFNKKISELGLEKQIEVEKVNLLPGKKDPNLTNMFINVFEPPYLLNNQLVFQVKETKEKYFKEQEDDKYLKKLMEIVFQKPADLTYDSTYTLNAMACYELRSCNCFGITNLMLGVAREGGLKAHYVLIEDKMKQDYVQENLVYSNHIACEVFYNNDYCVIDIDNVIRSYRIEEILTDIEAAGLFYCNIATKYMAIGNYDKALEIFEIAEKMYPESYQLHNNLGVLYLKINEIDLALKHFETGVKLSKYPEIFLKNFRVVSERTGNKKIYKKAIKQLKRIKDRNPYLIITKKVIPCLEKRDYSQALFFLNKAENVGKDISDVYFAKALCFRKLGQSGLEMIMLEKAAKLCDKDKYYLIKELYDRICPPPKKDRF